MFIGSSDLRPRNLRRRVELLVPVVEAHHRARLERIMDLYLNDEAAWVLQHDGSYQRAGAGDRSVQSLLVTEAGNPLPH